MARKRQFSIEAEARSLYTHARSQSPRVDFIRVPGVFESVREASQTSLLASMCAQGDWLVLSSGDAIEIALGCAAIERIDIGGRPGHGTVTIDPSRPGQCGYFPFRTKSLHRHTG